MNRTLPLIALMLFLSIQMMAQPLSCLNFEDIPANTQLGPASGNSPGDVLFSQAGIQVSIREIQYPDGSTGFANAVIQDAGSGWLDGQFLFMGNNSLFFDFSQADGSLNQLCFDFFDGGGVENFAVNGSSVAVVDNFSEITALNFPGVTVDVTFISDGLPEQGTVCITGNIESLLIGGQEFGIDNVCADAVLACPIANLQAEIVSCDDAGNYNIEVDFDWLSPLTVIASFDIFIEGEQAAFISQADLPYLLEGVQPATDALEFTLTVCQNDNPNCCESIILQKQCPTGSCVEFEGLAEPSYGSSSGTPAGTEIYSESGIGLRLIPFQSLFWTTTYGDLAVLNETNNPEMTAASGQYLQFESINAVFDLTGYSEPVDSIVVDFYYNGGAVNLAANGSNFLIQNALAPGLYALAPGITLRVVFDAASDREGQLIFYGNVQSLLIGGDGDFRIDNLCVNPQPEPCRMGNMAIELGPCNADGGFLATIDFEHQGTSDSFNLFGPGADGHFAYADLPVTVGPLQSNNSGIYAFAAVDLAQDGCWVGDTIQGVPCTGCAFEGLSIDYLGLADNGQNAISLNFELVGPTLTDFFSVYFDGELYERFSWNDVPVRLLVPCNTNDLVQEITVCEGEDHCCVTVPLIYLQPCGNPCNNLIDSVAYYLTDCNNAGNYTIVLDQLFPNPPNLSFLFNVSVDGVQVGSYSSASLPIDLGVYPGDGSEHEVAIYTQNTAACGYQFTTQLVQCNDNCQLDAVYLVGDV
ncbi:MAG: hypothetical protein KDD01_26555, partial [Phaeodactylibacter sp.]|nr:hypothetical protein [Phaeodactylibacter sp.]